MSFELKPFQRVKLRNGREGIVVDNPITSGLFSGYRLIIILTNGSAGFMPADMVEKSGGGDEWNVQQVWDYTGNVSDLLTFSRRGNTLWKEGSAAVAQAKSYVESAKLLLASAENRLARALEVDK